MTNPLTAAQLQPLLDILSDPNNPNFQQALNKLTSFNPQGLSQPEILALTAKLETTLALLEKTKAATADQLTALRSRNKALGSYNRVK